MLEIKNIKDNVSSLKERVDMIICRSNVKVAKLDNSIYPNSSYQYVLPAVALDEDNAIEYLKYYKRAVFAATEKRLRTIAIEAIDCNDDDLSWSIILELKKVLEDALKFNSMKIYFVCKNAHIKEMYDLAIFGESRAIKIELTDALEFNNVILVPTKEKLKKFDKSCKKLKRTEHFTVFFRILWKTLSLGNYHLMEGQANCDYYFLVNMIKPRITFIKDYKGAVVQSIKNVLAAMHTIQQKNITIPITHFTKNQKENRELVREIIRVVCETAEKEEFNVKFYCKDKELYDFVANILSEHGGITL